MGNYNNLIDSQYRRPLKIYLSKENAVVIMYTGTLYDNTFEIQNTTCVVSKEYFYKALDELREYATTTIIDNELSIKIDTYEGYCSITVSNKNAKVEVIEESKFKDWLLSIDLRTSKRIETRIPVSVESEFSFEYGTMIDISVSGCQIAVDSKINTMGYITLSIFDDIYPVGDVICEIKRESNRNNKFLYGLEIKQISPEAEYRLREIVNKESNREK